MTDTEINTAIAEACGNQHKGEWWCQFCQAFVKPEDVTYDEKHDVRAGGCNLVVSVYQHPDYVHDLNAMHTALVTLSDAKMFAFRFWCSKLTPKGEFVERLSARQLAEAWLRYEGLWKEDKP